MGTATLLYLTVLLIGPTDLTVVLPPAPQPPLLYGAGELQRLWQPLGIAVSLSSRDPGGPAVVVSATGGKPESFTIRRLAQAPPRLEVAAADPVGAMYGLLELADWLPATLAGTSRRAIDVLAESAPTGPREPAVELRAPNLFLSLPYPADQPWWFLSDEWWTIYLDTLAHSRFNWLDLHGMYDVRSTGFPNLYPYFVTSPSFPDVGVPPAERRRNLAMLQKVVAMAGRRGIKVALMSYAASWRVPGGTVGAAPETDENLARYTREAVAELLRAIPELAMIGFRIGESGRREGFYRESYLPGIADSGRDVLLYTRSWGANAADVRALGRDYPGRFVLEIKYNGEQYGLPYIVAGGRAPGWTHYFYEDYTTLPRDHEIVWQIRQNGTNRFFRWADPAFVQVTAKACKLAGAKGFCVEDIDSYFPKTDQFHRPNCGHGHPHWMIERYWLFYLVWGRLTYQPDDPLWRLIATQRLAGGDRELGRRRIAELTAASRLTNLIYAAHCLGPDHRNMAPEFETGGDILGFGRVLPFDTFAFQSPDEWARAYLSGRPDGRLSPYDLGWWDLARQAAPNAPSGAANARPPAGNDEWECWRQDNEAVAALGYYYGSKLMAAGWEKLYEETGDEAMARIARTALEVAVRSWRELADRTAAHYTHVHDTLRMKAPAFLWSQLTPEVEADLQRLDERQREVRQQLAERGGGVGHAPRPRAAAGLDLWVRASPTGPDVKLDLLAELRDGAWHSIPFEDTPLGLPRAVVPAAKLPDQRLRYVIRARAGDATTWLPPERQQLPFVIRLWRDRVSRHLGTELTETSRRPDRRDHVVRSRWADADALRQAWIWTKSLPSTRHWRRRPAQVTAGEQPGEWLVSGSLSATPEGLMWAIEVVDSAGNATRWPRFDPRRPDIPYRWIDPWDGPLPATVSLANIPAETLSRARYAALLLGREATAFHTAPLATKEAVLQAVAGGIDLVIFNQDFPDRFSYDWLPGGMIGGDRDGPVVNLLPGHPITAGLPARIEGEKVLNDAIDRLGEGWTALSDPPALAVRQVGHGRVIVCQLRVLQLVGQPACEQLLRQILADVRRGSTQPFLILDPGTGDLVAALDRLGEDAVELGAAP